MVRLVKNEFRKFSNTYINIVSLFAMLVPILFTAAVYYFNSAGFKHDWKAYTTSLHLFHGIFLGAIVPSFIAIFSIYHEIREGTMKNLLASPFSREKIIISKIVYVSVFVIGLYFLIAVLVILSGIMIGFDASASELARGFKYAMLPGIATIIYVPMMIFLTLLFKSFIPPLVISVFGTIIGLPLMNIKFDIMSYYPWTIPTGFFFRLSQGETDLRQLLFMLCGYYALFVALSVFTFRQMDFDY